MVQLGFVIDHSRCIGCHACTVACKSENEVPVGVFRTWVKYTEQGTFPEVKRSFSVLRCNQCTNAPCVTICPTSALEKRASDGIVDVNPDACIGCKSCMQGCPYDALHINEDKGTAEKCHFCAHRTELGLAPACAVVCPTEAIIPGDFHDPQSRVARMKASGELSARKTEAGTNPNVWYRDVNQAAIRPLEANRAGGYIWSDRPSGPQEDAQAWEALQAKASARAVYDVAHPPLWGGKISGYLFFKSLAAGIFLAGSIFAERGDALGRWLVPGLSTFFLLVTTALLILDLKRPERFLYILMRPNWSSWLTRGSFLLVGYGALLGAWLALALFDVTLEGAPRWALVIPTALLALGSASYTAGLFAQAKGRVLWMRRHFAEHLAIQALLAGTASLSFLGLLVTNDWAAHFRWALLAAVAVHLVMTLLESRFAPRDREAEYERAHALIAKGPYAKRHWGLGVLVGCVLPIALLLVPGVPALWSIAGALALVGLWVEEDLLVRAGQLLPIS